MSQLSPGEELGIRLLLLFGMAMALFTGFAVGHDIGGTSSKKAHQADAIENNAAHWQIDAKTGERRFVWGNQ